MNRDNTYYDAHEWCDNIYSLKRFFDLAKMTKEQDSKKISIHKGLFDEGFAH